MTAVSELLARQHALYTSGNPTRRWLHCARRDCIRATLRRVAAAGAPTALEVGPGSGVYTPLLADRVTVSDREDAYLGGLAPLVAARPHVVLVRDDITRSALPAGRFDVVLCSEVIEHLTDSPRARSGMRRLLRPGGTLILSTPQRHSSLEVLAKIAFLPGVIDLVRLIYREPILATGQSTC